MGKVQLVGKKMSTEISNTNTSRRRKLNCQMKFLSRNTKKITGVTTGNRPF